MLQQTQVVAAVTRANRCASEDRRRSRLFRLNQAKSSSSTARGPGIADSEARARSSLVLEGTGDAMTDDAIMRWENEGGALLSGGSPALERPHPDASHPETDAAERRRADSSRAEPADALERDVRPPVS